VRAGWLREALRWKARKGGSRWGRGGKKATLEALFAALRPHGLCPRTWNRAPTPSAARGHAQIKIYIVFKYFVRKNVYL